MTNRLRFTTALVAALATSACFATRNDVRILQRDVDSTRRGVEQRITRLETMLASRLDSLDRVLRKGMADMVDSTRAVQNRFYDTGGKLSDNQSAVLDQLERLVNLASNLNTEVQRQGREMSAMKEELLGLKSAAAMRDSTIVPTEGPASKLEAARNVLASGAHQTARDLASEVIAEAKDTALIADAQYLIADTFVGDNQQARRDSVFQVVFEKYPAAPVAPMAMYRYGISLKDSRQNARARDIFNRVIAYYPNSEQAGQARDRLREIIPPG